MRSLIYLELRQLANALKNALRHPKRLIPAVLFAACVLSWLVHGILYVSGSPPTTPLGQINRFVLPPNIDLIKAATFLLLSLGCVMVIYQAFSSGLLVFTVAHIDFLFPTPVSRRAVLLLKLAKDYLKYGFWVAFFYVFVGAPVFEALKRDLLPLGLVGMAGVVGLLILVVNVAHTVNIVFTFGFERLKYARLAVKSILFGALASAVGYAVWQYIRTGSSYAGVLLAADSPLLNAVFAPARWCSTLVLAPVYGVIGEDYAHLGLLWGLAAVSFLVLISRKENFYEPSLGITIRSARRRLAVRSGDLTGLRIQSMRERGARKARGIRLPPFGQGATAFFWKNLTSKLRISSGQLVIAVAAPVVLTLIQRQFASDPEVVRTIPFLVPYAAWLLAAASQPMRAELKHADILKAMPVSAWKVVTVHTLNAAFYIGAATLILSLAMWLLVPETRGQELAACTLVGPFVGFAVVSFVTISSLLYPDIRDTAQNYLCGMVAFLLSLLAFLPALIVGVFVILVLHAPYAAAAAVCGANVAGGIAGIAVSSTIFRAWDPTSD